MSLPRAPVVPQIPAGWDATQADFDSWVTTPFSALASPPGFRGELHAATPLSGTVLAPLDTVLEDPYGGWSAVATSAQAAHSWLCPEGWTGWYDVSATGAWTAGGDATEVMHAHLYLNGTVWARGGTGWMPPGRAGGSSGGYIVPLVGGQDYLQLYLYSTASVNAPATAGEYPSLDLTWISS